MTCVDELGDRLPAVADDLRRLAAGGGDELAADDQEAVVGARGEPLDDDLVRALLAGAGVGRDDLLAGRQVVATPRPWLP